MIPTVDLVLSLAAAHLGDEQQEVFTNTYLLIFWPVVYQEMISAFKINGLAEVEMIALYTLASGTTSLTPATAGITNFGRLVRLEERGSGSTDNFSPMQYTDVLSQRPQTDGLGEFTLQEETFQFIGATTARQLRITYYASGNAPALGVSVGVDDCLNFCYTRLAALAGPPKGYVSQASVADLMARGPNPRPDGSGGYLWALINSRVLEEQINPVKPRPYGFGDQLYFK